MITDSGLLDLFSINVWELAAAFLFGVVGYWLFREGRRREHSKSVYIGLALMIYPYFVSGVSRTWLVGLGLCAAARYYWDQF